MARWCGVCENVTDEDNRCLCDIEQERLEEDDPEHRYYLESDQ